MPLHTILSFTHGAIFLLAIISSVIPILLISVYTICMYINIFRAAIPFPTVARLPYAVSVTCAQSMFLAFTSFIYKLFIIDKVITIRRHGAT
jgi:hypothetical protein